MRYTLQINCDRLKPLKIIILAACLVVDFGNLWIFLAGIATKNIWEVVKSLAIFVALLLIRVIACTLTYKWNYDFDNEIVEISKVIFGKKRQTTTIEYAKIENIAKLNGEVNVSAGAKILAPKICKYQKYAITCDSKQYIVAMDEYGYCKVKGRTNDLS